MLHHMTFIVGAVHTEIPSASDYECVHVRIHIHISLHTSPLNRVQT